jgi:hypothetical protein
MSEPSLAPLWMTGALLLGAQVEAPEHRVKAFLTYNFATDAAAQWPATAFANPEAPFVVGLLTPDPAFEAEVKAACRDQKAQGRPIKILTATRPEELKAAHLAYLPSAAPKESIDVLKGHPIITLSDRPGFCERGGIVRFFPTGGKIRWEINPKAAKEAGISVRGLILQHARIVESEENR